MTGAKANRVPRGPATFKQADVTRAINAYVKMGIPADRVCTAFDSHGRVIVFVAKSDEAGGAPSSNPWDEVFNASDKKRSS
jgi:hypothetical protein